jgi:outer membrane protein OmpA-like peptidoglycan-associated protein
MTTLLLTFFVLLISLAQMQDPEHNFNKGREAFVRHINTMGLGLLFGKKVTPEFEAIKAKYYINNPDEDFAVRTIDAKEEKVRRVFKEITRSMTAMPSRIVAKKTNFVVTNISFSQSNALLGESAKKFLVQFTTNLQQNSGSEEIKLYVLGLANDEQTEKEQWILSARRAQTVADFLNYILPPEHRRSIYSWGAGPGSLWVGGDSTVSKQTQILIAVLNEGD